MIYNSLIPSRKLQALKFRLHHYAYRLSIITIGDKKLESRYEKLNTNCNFATNEKKKPSDYSMSKCKKQNENKLN